MEHTKTPWKIIIRDSSYMERARIVDNNDSITIAVLHLISNADFIVQACNHYEELVEALKNILPFVETYDEESALKLASARAVLAKIGD